MSETENSIIERCSPDPQTAPHTGRQEVDETPEHAHTQRTPAPRSHAKRFQSLVTALAKAQIVWITDAQGKVLEAPGWLAFTGQSRADVEAGNWLPYVHPEDQVQVMSAWTQSIASRSRFDAEYRLRKQDGTYEYFEVHGVPVLNSDNSILEWVGTSANVTAHKEAKVTVERLRERLRCSIMEMDHRVKNNLQIISALLETHKVDTSEAMLRRVSHYTHALASLHDLLARAAKESGEETDGLSMPTILGHLIPLLQVCASGRRIAYEAEEVLSPVQEIASLTFLINELVLNAIQHGKGDIELTFAVKESRARLEVCDDGPGFPLHFEPRQAAKTGLELVQSAACHDLRGEVAFTNRPDGGARVVVEFPFPQLV
jgi:PAS domain S-box-containing protein